MLLPLVADVPGESSEFLDRMSEHSKTLQAMIDRAGMTRGAGSGWFRGSLESMG